MKIYTKTGDDGETGLFGGPRVRKDDPRIEAYGDVDELNATVGWVRSCEPPDAIDEILRAVQNDLFAIGAELATPDPEAHHMVLIDQVRIAALEQSIDQFEASLSPLKQFILPGGTPAAAALHVARTVCRRAERRIVTLDASAGRTISREIIVYMNRLSDLLFVLARSANSQAGAGDVPWQPPREGEKS